jgi:hypothetical protein
LTLVSVPTTAVKKKCLRPIVFLIGVTLAFEAGAPDLTVKLREAALIRDEEVGLARHDTILEKPGLKQPPSAPQCQHGKEL